MNNALSVNRKTPIVAVAIDHVYGCVAQRAPGRSAARPEVIPMAKPRQIAGIHRGGPLHWVGDGFRVSTYFPAQANWTAA
jgi:hypothetical protein